MEKILLDLIKNKRILVLGFGREGKSTFKLLEKIGGFELLEVADANEKIAEQFSVRGHFGADYLSYLDEYDVVFKSPGIALDKNNFSCLITSQTEIFLKKYKKQTVGITGTKGKSTVSSLIYHVLSSDNDNVCFCGNIGIPFFDVIEKIDENTTIVTELSCHQTYQNSQSPRISVLLNLYEDHLDNYGTFENYCNAKKNIYKNQNSDDILIVSSELKSLKSECKGDFFIVDRYDFSPEIQDAMKNSKLCGEHNLYNCSVAYKVVSLLGITFENFKRSLSTYLPLSHRMEFIGKKNGVSYYDDSISTTVESTICAIKSIPNLKTVIIGGLDRGIDYENLICELKKSDLENVIFAYSSGKRIHSEFTKNSLISHNLNLHYAQDLKSAVQIAIECAKDGTACALSPAAASYDAFKDFADRGNFFKNELNL